ncbi:hypothetical protein N7457_005696 [Penicillium paradoxum]|uniref:uncharacterized protein n=1 Tax=Penicillium paradoxum TaxID=176176 RepID=UPI0025489D2A|nr:uncharacterized protein N7457_005696 [Penicillium paradoxum]KAJ5780536.1 hypothetical protein N7457_005696 [Penicillium paradoxum]
MQNTCQFPLLVQTPHQLPSTLIVRPRPRFCVLRPGGFWTPLIPLDELPHWLEIRNWAPDIHMGMYPASMSYMPREGSYDVVCHHCGHGLDSLQQSVSEREAWSVEASNAASSKNSSEPALAPKPQHTEAVGVPTVYKSSPNQVLQQPPFGNILQTPFVGMCVVDMHAQYPNIPADTSGPRRRMSIENSAPPPIFGINVGSPSLSMASSGNARRPDSPWPGTPSPPHAHSGSFGKPQHGGSFKTESIASMQSASVASTRSLTAAALQQMRRMRSRRLSRGSSLHTNISATGTKSLSQVSVSKLSRGSKASMISKASKVTSVVSSVRVISKHRRKVLLRRQRAEARRAIQPPLSAVSVEAPEPKPEQVNSATKRRDRRERMMQKRKQSDRGKQPYRNMMRIPNWSPGMSKH